MVLPSEGAMPGMVSPLLRALSNQHERYVIFHTPCTISTDSCVSIGEHLVKTALGLIVVTLLIGLAWPTDKYRVLKSKELLQMLDAIHEDIKQHYYDPSIHGFDLDGRFAKARNEILGSKSESEGLLDIAAAVESVDDSHTHFRPPTRPYGVDYGWIMEPMGESGCFVTAVRPDTDAFAKGLKPGDKILSINGIAVTRQNLRFIEYAYHVVPQSGFHLSVQTPAGVTRNLVAMATVIPGQSIIRHSDVITWLSTHHQQADRSQYFHKEGVLFWKLPDFLLQPSEVDDLVNKAHSFRAVVLDLRGNRGGLEGALEELIGGFFDEDVEIGDVKARDGSMPWLVHSSRQKAFSGNLIVLVDSSTGSAAEIFSRVVQIEKRGTVVGDRTMGAVMQGKTFMHVVQLDPTYVTQYGVEVSTAELIMRDGKPLEKVGIMPDERILSTPDDLVLGRDPALARAAELAGVKISADEASKIFPFRWPKQRMPEID